MKNTFENQALIRGRIHEQQLIANHYLGLAANVDPYEDWNRYADLREKAEHALDTVKILNVQLDDMKAGRSAWTCFRRDVIETCKFWFGRD